MEAAEEAGAAAARAAVMAARWAVPMEVCLAQTVRGTPLAESVAACPVRAERAVHSAEPVGARPAARAVVIVPSEARPALLMRVASLVEARPVRVDAGDRGRVAQPTAAAARQTPTRALLQGDRPGPVAPAVVGVPPQHRMRELRRAVSSEAPAQAPSAPEGRPAASRELEAALAPLAEIPGRWGRPTQEPEHVAPRVRRVAAAHLAADRHQGPTRPGRSWAWLRSSEMLAGASGKGGPAHQFNPPPARSNNASCRR